MLNYTTTGNDYSSCDHGFLPFEVSISSDEIDTSNNESVLSQKQELCSRLGDIEPNAHKSLWAILSSYKQGKLTTLVELQAITGQSENHICSSVEQLISNDFVTSEKNLFNQREEHAEVCYRLLDTNFELLENLLIELLFSRERELNALEFVERECHETKEMPTRSIDDFLLEIRPPFRANHRKMAEFLALNGPSTAKEASQGLGLPRVETGRDQLHKLVKLRAAKKSQRKGSKEFVFTLLPNVSVAQKFTPIDIEVSEEMNCSIPGNHLKSHPQEGQVSEPGFLTERILKLYPPLDESWTEDLKKEWFVTFRQILEFEQQGRGL